MTLNNRISRCVIACVFALTAASMVSGARVVHAQGDTDYGMIQSLIDAVSRTEIHGFASQGFLWSSNHDYLGANTNKGDWHFNEIGINFSTDLSEKLRVGLQLISRSLGSVGNNAVQLDWAYADYRFRDWLGFRGGKMRVPYGSYNEIRDIDQLRTCIILPQSVYPESLRAFSSGVLGFGVYGDLPFESAGTLSYEVQSGTCTAHNAETGLKQTLAGIAPLYPDMDMNADFIGTFHLTWNTSLDGLRFRGGVAYTSQVAFDAQMIPSFSLVNVGGNLAFVSLLGNQDITPGSSMKIALRDAIVFSLSLEYVYEKTTFIGEFLQQKADLTGTIALNGLPITTVMPADQSYQEGFFLLLSYALTDSLEIGTYYSLYWPYADDRSGAGLAAEGEPDHSAWQHDIALSTRYDIFSFWSVKLEGHYMSGTGDLPSSSNPVNTLQENWFFGAFKTSVMF